MNKPNRPFNHIDSSNAIPAKGEALGQSEKFLEFQERLSKVAPINRPVLILGERGTGKELAATRLHFLSPRWQGPFVALNCSALSLSLIESELFGYEKGAFTGATRRRSGRFEFANKGTLFLDEIGNTPMEVQEKILRVVEYGTFEPVGSPERIEVDVRIIAATNADLSAMVKSGRFKQDLLDRLSFEVLFLPSLKERHEDISLLANHFASRMAFELGREEIPVFSDEAMKALESYPWPGNVRELKNVVERAIYRSDSVDIENITFDPFDTRITENRIDDPPKKSKAIKSQLIDDFLDMSFNDAVKSLSVFLLQRALNTAKHNQKKAARSLGLTYNQFRGLYRKYKAEIE